MTLQKKYIYIPQTWDEIIGQEEIVKDLSGYKTIEELPNLMFTGQSGIGKTASAYVLAKILGVPLIEKNASDDRGIDVIRNEVKTLLFTTGKRIILLDEAGNLTQPAQAALRRPMEIALQRTNNRLILALNEPWKIIDAISSRCTIKRFRPLSKEALTTITYRVLKREGMKFSSKEEIHQVVNALVSYSKGDARRLLDVIDNYSHSKESLIQYIRKKDAEVNQIREIFQASISGEWQETLMKLESYIIQSPTTNNSELIEMFYAEVKNLNIALLKKFVIYERLADTERALKLQTSPLVQISGFLVSVMAITHYKEK
ncbi:AAA family ATPase [candidate division WOR-3 bacterium]|nr:AAA family ATPase [candidate division WOR-3 bacterium]